MNCLVLIWRILSRIKIMVLIIYLMSFDEIPWQKSLHILPLWDMADEYVFPFCGEINSDTKKLGLVTSYVLKHLCRCATEEEDSLLWFSKQYSPSSSLVSNTKLFSKVTLIKSLLFELFDSHLWYLSCDM